MNIAPKNKTSAAKQAHLPSVAASFCCGISWNCSCRAAEASAIYIVPSFSSARLEFPFGFLSGILIRRFGNDGGFQEIVLGRRRGGLPFEAGGFPGIGRGFPAVLQRPDEINQRQQIAD